MLEIQARTNDSLNGGDWVTITYGKTIEQAIGNFRLYLKNIPLHHRPFGIHSKIKVYDRKNQKFIADYYI